MFPEMGALHSLVHLLQPFIAKKKCVIMIVNPIILFISNMDFVLVIFVEFISLDGAKMQPLICLFAVCELARIARQLLMHMNALWPYGGCINR